MKYFAGVSDFEREASDLARARRSRRTGFTLGALFSILVGLAACATTGSDGGDGAPAAPAVPPAPPPPAAPPPAVTAGATAATVDSPVAGYLADPAAVQRGSQLFRAVCTGYCHSTQPTADRVAPNVFDCEWTHGGSDQEIFKSIADGIPDTQMQAFGERLPHEDLWKIVAYMRQKSTCKG